ncbi:MAG: beta-ketoacyl-ACP synthase II [Chlamydiia bacterium]|nr:beta-ketoacyl-ACP synthase II [Chlamydiia bacterium]
MTKKRRVVVTGIGLVSCFGNDVKEFYNQLLAGKSGISKIEGMDVTEYPTKFAGEIKNFDSGDYIDKKQARRLDPFLRYSQVAGKRAIEDAHLDLDALDKARCGIIIGSGMGGMSVFQDGVEAIKSKGYRRLTPFFIPFIITNMASGLLSMDTGFTGPNYSISTACATSNYAIIAAAQHIQRGDADLMICGGTEAPVTHVGLAGFSVINALSTHNEDPQGAARPWDKNRDGFVIGEGAGVLVLEELEHAKARGAHIYAEYLGGAMNADAYHMTTPKADGSGVADCMRQALADGKIDPKRVNYVNAHATCTPVGDMCEVRGLLSLFGDHCKNITINATKSMTGHCLGAAGAIEIIATLMAITTGKVHPTINIQDPEPEMENFNMPTKAEELSVDVALSNSFGFGGHNAVIAVAPYKDA